MKLFPKLAIVLSAVTLVPIAVFGLLGLGWASDALRLRIEQGQAELASQSANSASFRVRSVLDLLRQNVSYGRYDTASTDVLTGMLRVAYRQSEEITIISLVDEHGEAVVPSVYLEDPQATEALRNHRPVDDADLARHGQHIPLEAALASGAAIGPPYGAPGRPRVALAVETGGRRDGNRLVLVAEMSLESLIRRVEAREDPTTDVVFLRPDGSGLADGGTPLPLPGPSGENLPENPLAGSFEVGGASFLGAYAPVPVLGWGVVVRRAEADALRPIAQLQRQSAYWGAVGVVLALLLAFVVARDLSGRIGLLSNHAQAIAHGKLGLRIPVRSSDELGRLAESYNKTSRELESQRDQIEAQHQEIREWNEELERRVEEKSEQLAAAQEIVLRSRRLAGLGVLGAGVAHEVNNPLASTLGFIQLVLRDEALDTGHRQCLEEAEKASLRIRKIAQELLKLADNENGPARQPVALDETVRRAAHMVVSQLEQEEIELVLELEEDLPPVAGNQDQLAEAVLHLIHNARQAIEGPGHITLRTTQTSGQVARLEVKDDGPGIPPELVDRVFDPFFTTKGDWEARGLGLAVVHKIADEHGGRLDLDSKVGEGTTVTITLPIASGERHLA